MVRGALILLLTLGVWAQERVVKTPYTFTVGSIEVKCQNMEVTRDKRYALVHAFARSLSGKKERASWQGWFTLITAKGEELRCSPDCGVDSGTGQHITMGEFEVERKPSKLLIYFNLASGELPVRLLFGDGAVTAPTSR